jgi:hypothetical protein
MWFSAIANYKSGLAHYKVVPDKFETFNACLERYDGKAGNSPPKNIVLIRKQNHWSGNISEQSLLDTIGEVIDRRTKGRLHYNIDVNKIQDRKGKHYGH